VLYFQRTRTTQNQRPLKDQRKRKTKPKTSPTLDHSVEWLTIKQKLVSLEEDTQKSSLSLSKTKYSSFKISPWPVYSEPPSALPNCKDAPTWEEGHVGNWTASLKLFISDMNLAGWIS
jgi:hypothetical protein